MEEKDFLKLSESKLMEIDDFIENNDERSVFDVEYSDGILTIEVFHHNKTYVINKNSGNQKIWVSSPVSGADYFAYNSGKNNWFNDQGIELSEKLFSELKDNFNFNF